VHLYRGYGLTIRSALAIPGAIPIAPPGAIDIDIRFGAAAPGPVSRRWGPYEIGPAGFVFAQPGVARYFCPDARTMLIERDGAAADADVAAMLVATAMPALLWSRGEIVLHAAAAMLPGSSRAVAVLGPSGSGKSTLLAGLLARGAHALADDSVCLRITDGIVTASGLPGGWHAPLTPHAPIRPFHPVPIDRQLAECPLGAMLFLGDPAGRPRALTGAAALTALLANRHRDRIARLSGREAAFLAGLAAITKAVAMYEIPAHATPHLAPNGFP